MKKAFTLIELLVVIAIIAILAAILFPVFAQAKTAAKKTVAISNQKQISLGLVMYTNDTDDQYPRRSGCEQGSAINPDLRAPALQGAAGSNVGCTGRFYNSYTWQTWQKYPMPYIKSVDLFFHPQRQKDPTQWTQNGQILNGFALNLGLTGSAVGNFVDTPWFGGSQASVPNPSGAFILAEMAASYAAPLVAHSASGVTQETSYPFAVREYWRSQLLKGTSGDFCQTSEDLDPVGSGPSGGMVLGMADGSAKFYQTKKFLGATPTMAEYLPGLSFPLSPYNGRCRYATSGVFYNSGPATPNTSINYPLWGLGQ